MRLAIHIEGNKLFARLHLTDDDKMVLRDHRHFLEDCILDRTPTRFEYFDPTWVTLFSDFIGHDVILNCGNKSYAHTCKEKILKAIRAVNKEVGNLIPKPEPEPEPVPPELGAPDIEWHQFFRHMAILAMNGQGKTNINRWRLNQINWEVCAGEHAAITMDAKGTFTDTVLRWKELPRDRVVVIDPERPLTVNLFDKGDGSPQALRDALALSTYVLSTMTLALSSFQQSALTYPLRLLFETEHPTIDGLIDILRGDGRHPDLHRAPRRVQEYFNKDFKRGESSRNQLLDRLNALLADPIFEALFCGETTFDLFAAMQRGSFIVIDAREGKLGKECELWGRFWIAMCYRAAMARLGLPEHERTPVSFLMDEAQTFIAEDEMLAQILDKAREAKMGMFLSFHHLEQIRNTRVRDSILTNTAIKLVARSSGDIHNLCRSLGGVDPDFLNTLGDYEFAYFGPNMREAMKVKLPLIEFEQHPPSIIAEIVEESYQRHQRPRPNEPEPDPVPSTPRSPRGRGSMSQDF